MASKGPVHSEDQEAEESEDIASLDDTIEEPSLIEVTESMCRVIGTFEGNPAICLKDAKVCRRHCYGKKTKERVPPGQYPEIRNYNGKLAGAEPPTTIPTKNTRTASPMGSNHDDQIHDEFGRFDGDSFDTASEGKDDEGPILDKFLGRDIRTPRVRNNVERKHVSNLNPNVAEGDLLRLLVQNIQNNEHKRQQVQPDSDTYFTVTKIPKPRVTQSLHEAKVLADQLDGHISAFPSRQQAQEYIVMEKDDGNKGLTRDLFTSAGVDQSTGKGKALFGHHITTEAELLKFLVPNNLDSKTMALLGDLMLDSIACPGAVRRESADDHFEQLTSAMETIATGKRANEGGMKDLHWRNAKQTSLASCKDEEDMTRLLETLMEEQHEILEKRTTMITSILRNQAGWAMEKATLYGKLCLINRVGQDTYGFYVGFIIHLLRTSVREGWNVAEVEIKLFLEKTNSIRGNNVSRLCAMSEIYCYIRDQQKNRWRSLQLLERRLVSKQASGQNQIPGVCGHCGTTMHPGGKKKCPLKHLKPSEAQARMYEFFQKQFGAEKT